MLVQRLTRNLFTGQDEPLTAPLTRDFTEDLGDGRAETFFNKFGGAAAAYSLRALGSYNENVVRVRRESDNSEKDFTAIDVAGGEMARWVNEQPTLPLDLRELDTETGERDGALIEAAAAYSLRNLKASGTDVTTSGDTAGDTTGKYVVQVRRDSDDAVKSFTAAEVADGTLTDWVNADVVKYTSDFSSGTDGHSVPSFLDGTIEGNIDNIGGRNDNLRFTVGSTQSNQGCRKEGVALVTEGDEYNISFDYYIPSSNQDLSGISVNMRGVFKSESAPQLDQWNSFSLTGTTTSSGAWYLYANNGVSSAFTGNGTDVLYVRNIVVTQTSADGHVKTWYDQSGSDNHATQTDTAKQPKIVDGGNLVTDRDGKVALNGKGAKLDMPVGVPMLSSDGTYSLFAAVDFDDQRNGNDNFNNILRFDSTTAGGASSGRKPLVYLAQSDGRLFSTSPSFPSGSVDYTLAETLSVQLFTNIANPALPTGNNTAYADGVLVSTTSGNTDVNTDTLLSTSSQIFDDQETTVTHFLSEVIYYPSDQSDKRRAIEENIANHYDITLAAFSRDGTVSTWYDQSGSTPSNDAVQTDPAKQPKIVENGNILKDSRNNPAIDFDDVDDTMDLTSDLVTGGAYSFIAYHEFNVPTMILKGDLNYPRIRSTSNTNYQVSSYSPILDVNFTVASTQGLVSFIKDTGNNGRLYANGAESSSGQQAIGSGSEPFTTLGAQLSGGPGDGKLVEMIYYESDQTDNRTAIEANIGETYGITAIPAANDTVNGYVQTWYDQSGEGNDATQIVASKQPKIVGEVTSGEPHAFLGAIEFDGSKQFQTITLTSSAQPNSIFSVSNTNVAGQTHGIYGTNANQASYYRSSNKHAIYSSGTGSATIEGSAYVVDTDYLRFDLLNGANSVVGVNGTTTSGTTGDEVLDRLDIGNTSLSGANPLNGGIKELILYTDDQSSNRTAIETNIANQYGITLS